MSVNLVDEGVLDSYADEKDDLHVFWPSRIPRFEEATQWVRFVGGPG
jgi:hypothetical protein